MVTIKELQRCRLAPLPSDWNVRRLGEIAETEYGVSETASDEPNAKMIGMKHLANGSVRFENCTPVQVSAEVADKYRLSNRDLVFNRTNSFDLVGKTAIVRDVPDDVVFASYLVRIHLDENNALPEFVNYFMNSHLGIARIKSLATPGVSQYNVNPTSLRNQLLIPLPTLPEQQKISALLSTWDRAIELTEKLIAAKQKRKQALMQQLLSGKVRFAEFVKSRDVFETRYGNYPKDWKFVRIEKIAKQVSEKNSGGECHQVLSCTKHDGLVDSLGYFGKQIFSDNLSTYKIVRKNEFAYATNHIEEGSIGYQDVCDVAVISPMYTVFRTNDGVDDGYLYKLLKSDLYVHIYQVNTSASVDRRGSLRWAAFSHIRIPLPSLQEQQAIAAVLDIQQTEIDALGRKRDALKRQKKGVMQKLLIGKVRVNVDTDEKRRCGGENDES